MEPAHPAHTEALLRAGAQCLSQALSTIATAPNAVTLPSQIAAIQTSLCHNGACDEFSGRAINDILHRRLYREIPNRPTRCSR